ncbi:MAG: YczE/YyaS/YitT family protein [Filifactoraceae bacterium]
MNSKIKLYFRLMLGLFVCGLSIVMNINANIGVAPWNVLATGFSNSLDMTIGQASIIISVVVVIVDYVLGIKLGLGTLINMIFVGLFTDMIIWSNFIPKPATFPMQCLLLVLGMITLNIGMLLYIGVGRGAGPRDGLMLGISKKLDKPVFIVRTTIEILVTIVGILLGGYFGIGTIVTAAIGGSLMGFMYKLIGFNIKGVEHKFINDYFKKVEKFVETE